MIGRVQRGGVHAGIGAKVDAGAIAVGCARSHAKMQTYRVAIVHGCTTRMVHANQSLEIVAEICTKHGLQADCRSDVWYTSCGQQSPLIELGDELCRSTLAVMPEQLHDIETEVQMG